MRLRSRSFRTPIATDLDGSELFLTAHDVDGAGSGSIVGVVAGVGIGEWLSVRVVRALHEELTSVDRDATPPTRVVRLVPVGSPLGFASLGSEVGPAGLQDSLESEAGIPARTRAALTDQLMCVDVAVELRCGSWASATCGVTVAGHRSAAVEAVLAALPGPLVATAADDPRDATGSRLALAPLVARGVPVVSYSVGGTGIGASQEATWVADACAALLAWLRAPTERVPARSEAGSLPPLRSPVDVRANSGGLLEPSRAAHELLGTHVAAGTVLATVRSPYSFTDLEKLFAPVAGSLVRVAAAHPVRPGEPAFAIAPAMD